MFALFVFLVAPAAASSDDAFERLASALTFASPERDFRARVSGTLDLEGYALPQPSPGLLYTSGDTLFMPRLTLFLDGQLGARAYVFAQARADRGYDPSNAPLELRFDEYALRFALLPRARLNVQVGKFATVVGNWVARHGSWSDPFVTAPLPYEHLTPIWHTEAARSANQLLNWSHRRPNSTSRGEQVEKAFRSPIVWGASYTHGVALAGRADRFDYALEMKSASLASHPEEWSAGRMRWSDPSFAGRIGYRPDLRWNFGLSAATGPYLRHTATVGIAPDRARADYRQNVFAADLGFAWRHWQLWAEVFTARFAIPKIANADTTAYYVEAKYKFTPRLSGAVRWNQQLFATIPDGRGGRSAWGREVWRVDVAPAWRFTAQIQFKLQYSLLHDPVPAAATTRHIGAAQWTVRF